MITSMNQFPEGIIVTKTIVPVNELTLPPKFKKMNEILSKTKFLP
jgi:hypothetical protein